MPTPIDDLIKNLDSGRLAFAEVSEALSHPTIPVRVSAVAAMTRIAERSAGADRAAAIDQLKAFALTPGNQAVQRLGPPLAYTAVEFLVLLGDERARRAAHEVYDSLQVVERLELEAYLANRGVRL